MQQQTALFLPSKNGEYSLGTRPIPQPSQGELLVKVKAAALNPEDWKIQKYGWPFEEYPTVAGIDISGEVVALGPGITRFTVGDQVFGQGMYSPDYAGFQEYSVMKEDFTAKVPQSLSYEEASTFPVALSAAYLLFFNEAPHGMGLKPLDSSRRKKHYEGEPILVIGHGGSSSVGQYVIQLAKAAGFSPIITTASQRHTEKLKALGATHIIERTIPLTSIRSHLAEILNTSTAATGGLFGYIYDAISEKETQLAAYDLLRPSGKLAIVLPSIIETKSEDRHIVWTMGAPNIPHNTAGAKELFSLVTSMIENGVLMPTEIEILPGGLGGIVDGLKILEAGKVSGKKLVVRPEEQ
ncbi:Zinc-type alcohol dehydrogenase-like protein C2E1P3.01 [Leucoagaricus sp. SymC.cos]|nr:Zinc-type alcohol dehydrogenase-like protein C2E1P3.01 [Leucoagaricus sp. SymC.cos]